MDVTGLVIFLAIGAVAGWLAGTLMKGGGFGLLGNIVIGIIGAVVGGFVLAYLALLRAGYLVQLLLQLPGLSYCYSLSGFLNRYNHQASS